MVRLGVTGLLVLLTTLALPTEAAPGAIDCSSPPLASPSSAAGSNERSEKGLTAQGEEPHPLVRDTEAKMLLAIVSKKPFSAEALACEYLVERNFERAVPFERDYEYGCDGIDEFTRHDRVAAVVPQIKAEYLALSTRKEFRVWLLVPAEEYDFKKGGFPTSLAKWEQLDIHYSLLAREGVALKLKGLERLVFVRMDEERARALTRNSSWVFELTIRPTGFTDRPNKNSSRTPTILATVVRARLFTRERGGADEVRLVRAPTTTGAEPLCEAVFEAPSARGNPGRR
jgi:hypothetical protein